MRTYHDVPLWQQISEKDWTDWHWQLQNAITNLDQLEQVVRLTNEERHGAQLATKYLKMRISPHIALMMDPDDPSDPLRLQFIPSSRELASLKDESLFEDVNADERYSPVEGLIHRYPSKVLIFPSNYCGAYCRYCFRRKLVRDVEQSLSRNKLNACFDYIRTQTNIEEVILSGGDPLVLGDELIEYIISSLSKIPHVEIIRLHTRLPVSVPFRITPQLITLLKSYKPIYMVIHIDTMHEFSKPMIQAVTSLVDNGIPCLASSPLLKGINDSEEALRNLWTALVKIRVKPYYLFHSDPVQGLRHFMVPIERGLEIVANLYDRMSGLAMPHYCFNVPNGGGHVLLGNQYVQKTGKGRYLITNFEGKQIEYVESVE